MTIGALLEYLVPELRNGEVIVVVDDSPDQEKSNLKLVLEKFTNVELLEGEVKGGRGYAVWRGMRHVLQNHPEVTHIIEADCDGSHQFEDIKRVSMADSSKEFVVGSRYLPESRILGWSISRRILSRFLNFLIPFILQLELRDITNGLRRYSRKSAEFLVNEQPKTKGFIYLSEQAKVLKTHGIIADEVPIVFASRIAGQSSVDAKDLALSLRGLIQIFMLRR
jgi:glycosyltransferase involved in cell wall biosynthesis